MRLEKLPGWALAADELAQSNADRWRVMSPAERWRELEGQTRDVMWAMRASSFPQRARTYEQPLPESTVRALARLRASRK